MPFICDDNMIQTLAPYGPDKAFDIGILPRRPRGRPPSSGMRCKMKVHDATAVMAEHDKHIENAKCGGRNREEINPGYAAGMVFEKRPPGLGRRITVSNYVLCNSGLGYLDTKHTFYIAVGNHCQLLAYREHFQVQRRPAPQDGDQSFKKRHEYSFHASNASGPMPLKSMKSARTEFLVGTGRRLLPPVHVCMVGRAG